jgi:hypothetical protein
MAKALKAVFDAKRELVSSPAVIPGWDGRVKLDLATYSWMRIGKGRQ